MQALVPTYSRRSFILRLSTLRTLAIILLSSCSHILIVYVDAVRQYANNIIDFTVFGHNNNNIGRNGSCLIHVAGHLIEERRR